MKKTILFLLLCLASTVAYTQEKQVTLSGTIFDQATKEPVEFASVRILNAKDSTYVTGTTSDSKGKFKIAIKGHKYILHVSFMGYKDSYTDVNTRQNSTVGNIYIEENSILLNEAVVEAKAVEIQIKGDTVEYNADSYKVQETAVLEDLLKKMPGVEIGDDGKITVNGKEIKKILVDGKEFFTNDPKVASKNLPAKMVNKLQVVDRKSEMAQMTGFDDDDEETVINLTVKKGMKQGVFGNAFVGAGNKSRREGNGMVNYMQNNTQVSLLGGANNTNNEGFSDLASSMGNSGPPRGVSFGGRNGITKSVNGGINFATETSSKFKLSGDAQYGSTDNNVINRSSRQYTDGKRLSNSNNIGNRENKNFNTNFRMEWTPDSLTRIIFRPTLSYGKSYTHQEGDEELIALESTLFGYNSESRYISDGDNIRFSGNLHMSRKLNDKGRTLSLSLSGGYNSGDSDGENWFERKFDPTSGKSDSILDQRFKQDDKSYNWRAYLSYVEPLGRNNFLQLSYNIRNNNSKTDKSSFNSDGTDYTIIDNDYTRYVKNDFLNQNITLSFKSVRKKFDYTLGVGLEPTSSKTDIRQPDKPLLDMPRKNFLSFAPSARFNYKWDARHNLRINYRGVTDQPSTMQLFNGITSSDGTNTTYGNPNLRPSFTNRVNVRYQKFQPEKASVMMVFANFNHISNDIVSISNWNNDGGRETTYRNVSGNMSGNVRFIFNTPLRNKRFSINSMTFGSYNRSNTFIDDAKNRSNQYTLQENLGLQFRSDYLDFNIRGNIKFSSTRNSIRENSNQDVFNYGAFASATGYLPFDFIIDSDVNYSTNSGYSSGFKQNEWLWNASIAKQIFKNKAGTIRFKIYDILKQRSNITRNITALAIEDATSNSLNRYFMVHFVYKFQLFKGGMKSGDMQSSGDRYRRGGGHGGGRGGHPM